MAALPDADRRPSPEALLALAGQEGRGQLKIFLGAAPGVGKTYEMLQSARRRLAQGADVVIGVVETHGRQETEALLAGFEILPRRQVAYRGRSLEEMDVDAILARRPALAIVDELAHSNAPGSRHPKRYQDVEELLAAGIDVYTTLNIQHVESLNDVVAKITRIRVRETVPDRILDRATDIEVIDLTPADLLQRLREGKVYVRDAAQRALRHYFSPGNLTALRELALRRTAQRVDDQMLEIMRSQAIRGPWAAGERVLVCVDEKPDAAEVVRYAKRLADRLRAPWLAVHVEGPRHGRLGERERDRIAAVLRLAERLGAEALTLPGAKTADELVAYARENNVTQIVLGKSRRSRWFELLHGSVVHDLVARAGSIILHVIPAEAARPQPSETPQSTERPAFRFLPYLASALLVAGATGVGKLLDLFIDVPNLSMVYLVAVLLSAIAFGLLPSLATALVSVLVYNFLFLPPLYTFTIADPTNVMSLVFFCLVAGVASGIAARLRTQTLSVRQQARTTAELYAFSRKLTALSEPDDILLAAAHQLFAMLRLETLFLLPDAGGSLAVRVAWPPEDRIDEADLAAAKWSWDHNQPAGRGSDNLPGARRLFLPLRSARAPIGVLGLHREGSGPPLAANERRLVDALIDQTVVAVERAAFAEAVDETRLLAETERLRGALLTSVSHDLRTPLATILGTVSSLRSYGALYDDATRDEMLAGAQEETERLSRFVANLLDMTRLDSGALAVKRESVDLSDLVGVALQRSGKLLARHRVKLALAPDLPMAELDFVLAEQVLTNLLDNAAKYAPARTEIEIRAKREGDGILLEVLDEGPGIPEAALPHVFDKFYRAAAADRQRAGTGLGLAICKGFVEAMGGGIEAANRTDRSGARIALRFPAASAAEPALE